VDAAYCYHFKLNYLPYKYEVAKFGSKAGNFVSGKRGGGGGGGGRETEIKRQR
jgi:hypothetical protein